MFLPEISVKRPIFATMIFAAIVVFGLIGYNRLVVDEYPHVDFPYVSVTTTLSGASPEVIEADVTDPLEEEINTIPGIKNLRSSSADGVSQIVVEFELERDIDIAAQDVRDKVAVARYKLPDDIEPPIVDKEDPQAQPIMWLAVSGDKSLREISDYAHYDLKPKFEILEGVGSILEGGKRQRAVRIWLDTKKMEAFQITAQDVIRALRREHKELPAGRIESGAIEFSVKTAGEFDTPKMFNDLIIEYRKGSPIRLSDVGYAEDGMEDRRFVARYRSSPGVIEPALGLGIKRQSDANTVAVADRVKAVCHRIGGLIRKGITLDVASDHSTFIVESIREVQFSIAIGILLVGMVVFLFLRNIRGTVFICLTIPTAYCGVFAVMYFLGFSLNNMTMLALALAVGSVTDDSIVVLDNIYRYRESGLTQFESARQGTNEIAFATIASTLALVAVFVPVAFMKGIIGKFFYEFGISVATANLFSTFMAITLIPMLCSRWLKLPSKEHPVYNFLEKLFLRLEHSYRYILRIALNHRLMVVLIAVGSFAVAMFVWRILGKELVPPEDRSQFMVAIKTPVGSSINYTDSMLQKCENIMDGLPEIRSFFGAVGLGGVVGTNKGIMFTHMIPKNEREKTQQDIMNYLRYMFSQVPGMFAFPIELSMTFGERRGQPLEFSIGGPDLNELVRLTREFISRMRELPGIVDIDTDLELGKPEVRIVINRNKAADLGVDATMIGETLQALVGGLDVTKYKSEGKRYDVTVRLIGKQRDTPIDIRPLLIRNKEGNLVALEDVVSVYEGMGLNIINRLNRQRSVTITANLESNKPLGTAVQEINAIAKQILPQGYLISLSGKAETFKESFDSLYFASILALIFTYIILASLFENFIHPFTVLLSIPLSMIGALGILLLTGNTINIFSMIGIILLMSIVTKNSILLVDYTNTLRGQGYARNDAVLQASPVRLRPILMTAFSTIFGIFPIVFGIGPGSETRNPMAIATVGGIFSSLLLTLIVVPVVYTLLDDLVLKFTKKEAG